MTGSSNWLFSFARSRPEAFQVRPRVRRHAAFRVAGGGRARASIGRQAHRDAGEALFARAREALAAVEDAENAARGADRLSGALRVALPATYGARRIAPLLPAFLEKHPLLKIDLMMSDRHENLIAEGADLALRLGEQPDSSFVARKLESHKASLRRRAMSDLTSRRRRMTIATPKRSPRRRRARPCASLS
jgi:DNA-binding transcriptional LysR family regulator